MKLIINDNAIVAALILLVMSISLCPSNGTPPVILVNETAPNTGLAGMDAVIEDNFKDQVYYVSKAICDANEMPDVKGLENLEESQKMVYVSLVVIESLGIDNSVVKDLSKGMDKVNKLMVIGECYNGIVNEWNELVPIACGLEQNSSLDDFNAFARKSGKFGFKSSYTLLRTRLPPMKAFFDGVYEAAKKGGFNDEKIEDVLSDRCGSVCLEGFKAAKGILGFLGEKASPVVDKALYEISGYLGEESGPLLFKMSSYTEYQIEFNIIPKARELARKIEIEKGG